MTQNRAQQMARPSAPKWPTWKGAISVMQKEVRSKGGSLNALKTSVTVKISIWVGEKPRQQNQSGIRG